MHHAETVLVTGASGFLATYIIASFLENGYHVRGTVRNEASVNKVRQDHPGYSEAQLSFAVVPDIAAEGALDDAVGGVSGVVHTAAPVFYATGMFDEKLLEPAVKGTRAMLESIERHGKTVSRVVLTSSLSAIVDSSKGLNPGFVYTEKDWNPIDIDLAKENPRLGYSLSKKVAEKEAWEWYQRVQPSFELSTICPPMIYGPVSPTTSLKHLNQSTADIWSLMSGEAKEVPFTPMPAFVDVRDAAEAHLRAYKHGRRGRFIPSGGKYLFADVCDILAKHFPQYADQIPKPAAEQESVPTYLVDNEWTKKELGMHFRGLEECIEYTGRSLVALDIGGKSAE